MNRLQLVRKVSERTGQTPKEVESVLENAFDEIMSQCKNGKHVTWGGFGTFKSYISAERRGRNMHTGSMVTIPSQVRPKFLAGSNFRALLKGEE